MSNVVHIILLRFLHQRQVSFTSCRSLNCFFLVFSFRDKIIPKKKATRFFQPFSLVYFFFFAAKFWSCFHALSGKNHSQIISPEPSLYLCPTVSRPHFLPWCIASPRLRTYKKIKVVWMSLRSLVRIIKHYNRGGGDARGIKTGRREGVRFSDPWQLTATRGLGVTVAGRVGLRVGGWALFALGNRTAAFYNRYISVCHIFIWRAMPR